MIYYNRDELEPYVISPTEKIIDAMRKMSKSKCGSLAVCEGSKYLGLVSDGDIRRSLLVGLQLETSVLDTTNKSSKTVTSLDGDMGWIYREIAALHIIPHVDELGALVGMFLNRPVLKHQRTNVIIMAGGLGKRLKPLTDLQPKALVQVLGRPLIEHVINGFMSYGFNQFTIVINHLGYMIKNHLGNGKNFFCDIEYIEEKDFLGTVGGASLVTTKSEYTFVTNCDIVTTINYRNLISAIEKADADFAVATKKFLHPIPFGVVETSGGQLKIDEKPTIEKDIMAGVYLFKTHCLKYLSYGQKRDMPEFLMQLSRDKKHVLVPVDEHWFDVGKVDTVQEIQKVFGV